MGKYRERIDIIADILQIVSKDAKKTHIMYRANLSYGVLQKYITNLIESALMSFKPESGCYLITDKGFQFLQTYKEYRKSNRAVEKRLSEIDNRKNCLMEFCQNF